MTADPGSDARLHLVKANRAAIYAALSRAVSRGYRIGDAVVVIADVSDTAGLELAKAACLDIGTNIDDHICEGQQCDECPMAIIVISIQAARGIFTERHPGVANSLERLPPPGCTRVVSIAGGAATLVHADVRPSAPIAEA